MQVKRQWRHMLFNNAALAAMKIRNTNKKVAVLDIDRHAGNGTYDILLNEENTLFIDTCG